MICLLALVVFSILGIFSANYRKIAFEAFDCVFRKLTLRKCETGLDTRLKSQITGKLLKKSPKVGQFVFKYFEYISWFFTALFIWSLVMSAIAGYNFYMYGNCNGPNQDGFCIFDPTGHNSEFSDLGSLSCGEGGIDLPLSLWGVNLSSFPKINPGAKNKVLFIGCFACEYTKSSYPTISKLAERDDVEFTFAHFPVKGNTSILTNYQNCIADQDVNSVKSFYDTLFSSDEEMLYNETELYNLVNSFGINMTEFEDCIVSEDANKISDNQISELEKTNIYGTPLVFVNGNSIVGPKPYRVYKRLLH